MDGWKKGWRDGGMEEREGRVTQGTHQKETGWGKQEERNKKRRTLSTLPFFLSKTSVTAVEACLLLLPLQLGGCFWTLRNPLPPLHLHISLPPSCSSSSSLLYFVSSVPLSGLTLFRRTFYFPEHNLPFNLKSVARGREEGSKKRWT